VAGEFTAERKLVILQSRLPATSWDQYKKFTQDISLGELEWVQLEAPAQAGSSATESVQLGASNADAERLVRQATLFERSNDWTSALAKLEEAKRLNSEQPFLWSNYGYIAMRQNRIGDASDDFRHELANHPEESYVVRLYAGMLLAHGDSAQAKSVLKAYFDRNNTDQQIDLMLASVQARDNLPDAISTLRRASDSAPDKPFLRIALGEYLLRNHQEVDAAALMKKMLAMESNDANLLNSAAYLLAESNSDLVLAEEKSRKSLDILATENADAEVSEANPGAFQRTSLLVAGWDTLGFILLKENRFDEACDYLEAAWRNRPGWEPTLHYGEVQEALGNRKEAMRIYGMAQPPSLSIESNTEPAYEQIKNRIKQLESEGVPPSKTDSRYALQQERTFALRLKATNSYWSATYRLLLDANGLKEAIEVGGSSPRQGVVRAIQQLQLPRLVPKEFKGRILRDAVISCSAGRTECEFVLMPVGGMEAERATQ
jgi:predicted Zn-dependent protease